MKTHQRNVCLLATGVALLMILFPPQTDGYGDFVGYSFIGTPYSWTEQVRDYDAEEKARSGAGGFRSFLEEYGSDTDPAEGRQGPVIYKDVRYRANGFDFLRLALQLAALGLASLGLLIYLGRPDRNNTGNGADEGPGSGAGGQV